jgi:transcriptional regulator with XRE-family HTH domain
VQRGVRKTATLAAGDALNGFGERLKELREKRGLTQEDFAASIHTHWTQVSRYERGLQFPTADRLAAMAKVLRTSTDALLFGKPKREEKIEFKNLRLYERFRALDDLPRQDQDVALQLIDALIAKRRMARVIGGE